MLPDNIGIAYRTGDNSYVIEKYTGETNEVDLKTLKQALIDNRSILGYKVCNDKLVEVETDDRMFLFKAFIFEYDSLKAKSSDIECNIKEALSKLSTRAIKMLYETYVDIYKSIYSKYKVEVEWVISSTGYDRKVDGVLKAATFKYDWSKGQLYNLRGLIDSKQYEYLDTVFMKGLEVYSDEFCNIFVTELANRYNNERFSIRH